MYCRSCLCELPWYSAIAHCVRYLYRFKSKFEGFLMYLKMTPSVSQVVYQNRLLSVIMAYMYNNFGHTWVESINPQVCLIRLMYSTFDRENNFLFVRPPLVINLWYLWSLFKSRNLLLISKLFNLFLKALFFVLVRVPTKTHSIELL